MLSFFPMISKRIFLPIIVIILVAFLCSMAVYVYKKQKMAGQYKEIGRINDHEFTEVISCPAKFPAGGGIEFLAWSVDKRKIRCGSKFEISYFWKFSQKPKDKISVFVYFSKDGNIVFQNDHALLGDGGDKYVWQKGKIVKESYMVNIPPEAPSGNYEVVLGLYLSDKGGRRLRLAGSRRSSVDIGEITVKQNKVPDGLKGSIVFQSDASGKNQIYVMDMESGMVKRLTSEDSDNEYPSWSPDGKQIVFCSRRDGNPEINVMDSDGGNQKRLTFYSGRDINPSWHPDGARIIFVSDRNGAMEFYLISKEGSGLARVTDFGGRVNDMPRISPDGEKIIFTSDRSAGWQIFEIDIDGKNPRRITPLTAGHCEGSWSHDGGKITFDARMGMGNADIWLMDKEGANKQRVTSHPDLDYNPRFAPDDRKIIFCSQRDGNWEVYAIDAGGCQGPVRITYTDANEQWPDWTVKK